MADITKPINITATPPPASIPTNPLGNVGVGSGALEANLPTAIEVSGKADVTTIAVAIHGLGEENIPDPRLFKFLADKFRVSERALLNAYKQVSETVRGSDASSRVARKVLLEAQTAREELRLSTKTSRYDQVVKSDQFSAGLAKPFTEMVSKSDAVLNKTTGKGLTETKTVADVFSKQIGIILAEIDYWLQDYGFDGYTERAVHLSDILSRIVSYKRTFTDIVDATDDFYGAANIDDDQVAAFGKALIESAQTGDYFLPVTSYIRSYTDTNSLSDTRYFKPTKAVNDTPSLSDTFTRQVQFLRTVTDSGATSELRTAGVSKASADTYRVTDSAVLQAQFIRGFTDTGTTSETKAFWSQPRFLDTKAVLDSSTKISGKYLQDNTATSKLIQLNVQNYSLDKYAAVDYVGQTFVY